MTDYSRCSWAERPQPRRVRTPTGSVVVGQCEGGNSCPWARISSSLDSLTLFINIRERLLPRPLFPNNRAGVALCVYV